MKLCIFPYMGLKFFNSPCVTVVDDKLKTRQFSEFLCEKTLGDYR